MFNRRNAVSSLVLESSPQENGVTAEGYQDLAIHRWCLTTDMGVRELL